MELLLDTHVFLWWINDDDKLSSKARTIITNGENELLLSVASGWEIVIKAQLGKIRLPGNPESFIAKQLTLNSIKSLPIEMSHVLNIYNLPNHHRDPFDRLIISQARLKKIPVLTKDPLFRKYKIKTIW